MQTRVRIEDTAQLQLRQLHHLGVQRALALQRQLIVVERDQVQAALETIMDPQVPLGVHEAAGV